MPKIINGEVCYTVDEAMAHTEAYILKTAEEIPAKLRAMATNR